MIVRLLQLGVVALWISMTFWLVRTTWFPDESRFENAELREVMNAMFENWNERAELVLLENGSEVGRMAISASHARDGNEELPMEERLHRLSSEGSVSDFGEMQFAEQGPGNHQSATELNARRDRFIWRVVVAMDQQYAFAGGYVLLHFPEQSAKVEVNYVKKTDAISIEAILNGRRAVQFKGTLAELRSSIPDAGLGMGIGMGFPMPFFNAAPEALPGVSTEGGGESILSSLHQFLPGLLAGNADDETRAKIEAMRPRLSAKFGRTKIAGESMPVYLVLVTAGAQDTGASKASGRERAIRLYIGEDGRPVLVDTPFGYEAIAEVLVPDPASAKQSSGDSEIIGQFP